ncbi:MAG: DUF59 domain-containing protein [Anaerolineae bacterium]|nr:DUF59 domain-containing protein [Anaerolineae bacterium]
MVEEAREALREVVDPEIGMDVVALGLIRDIQVEPDKGHVVMILTTPFCPYGPHLLEQARLAAQGALGRPTTIELGGEIWRPEFMEDGGAAASWGLF